MPPRYSFQSTRPRGARHYCHHYDRQSEGISIHSPAMGETNVGLFQLRSQTISIHSPARGETAKTHNLIAFNLCVFDKNKYFTSVLLLIATCFSVYSVHFPVRTQREFYYHYHFAPATPLKHLPHHKMLLHRSDIFFPSIYFQDCIFARSPV